jgi:hypothetical protein
MLKEKPKQIKRSQQASMSRLSHEDAVKFAAANFRVTRFERSGDTLIKITYEVSKLQ